MERRVEQKLATFSRRLKQLEDDLTQIESRFVSQDRYDEDARKKAVEIEKIKDVLATAASWQRGILAALGYIDVDPNGEPGRPMLPPSSKR